MNEKEIDDAYTILAVDALVAEQLKKTRLLAELTCRYEKHIKNANASKIKIGITQERLSRIAGNVKYP